MQQPARLWIQRRSVATGYGILFLAVSASCMGAPAGAASGQVSCPSGQFAATRIEYEGDHNLDPTVDVFNLHALVPNVGYKRRTVLVANGYYKEVSEGTIVVMKEAPPGKPVPIPSPDNKKLYARELPSRLVIMDNPRHKLVYDERGDPENLGTRTSKSKRPAGEDDAAIAAGLQAMLGSSGGNADVIGKATYAGIPCEVRKFLAPGNTICVATIRGTHVTLAEEMQFPHRGKSSWMKAKTKTDVCVSAKDFEPPASVRFKS